ncbi:hypothetical protein I552_1554 [Mycobacterium xenopi 3993]|nr:hypothetical protein I552_1554 [Mycobacterium xenopi 3993]
MRSCGWSSPAGTPKRHGARTGAHHGGGASRHRPARRGAASGSTAI